MGASGGKVQKTSLVPARRRIVLRKWRERDHGVQVCAVARHEERADAGFAIPADGTLSWTQTDDFRQWPKDPPLSPDGQEAAARLGQELHEAVAGLGARLHVVVASPYYRCVQTAAHICQSLGGRTQMLIDRSLGEVFSPEIMGEHEPAEPTRPTHEALAYCKHLGVRCHVTPLGQVPTWPEDLERARQRFIGSFVGYLSRSARTRRNFVLVTHADAVGATLSVMPSRARKQLIQKVEYGGYFLAHRKMPPPKACRRDPNSPVQDPTASVTTSLMQMSPSTPGGSGASFEEIGAGAEDPRTPPTPIQGLTRALKRGECADPVGKLKQESWQVRAQGVVFRPKHESGHNYGQRFASSLMRFSPYSKRKIKKALGDLPDVSLSNEVAGLRTLSRRSSQNSRVSGHSALSSHSSNSSISQSTYIFGNVGSQIDTLSSLSSVESTDAGSRRAEQETPPVDTSGLHVPIVEISGLPEGATVPGRPSALQQPDSPHSPMFVRVLSPEQQPDSPVTHKPSGDGGTSRSGQTSDGSEITAPAAGPETPDAGAPANRSSENSALVLQRKEERALSAGNVLQPPQLSETHGVGKAHSGNSSRKPKKGLGQHRKADRALSAGCPLPPLQQPDKSDATKPSGPSTPSPVIRAVPSSTSGSTAQSPPSPSSTCSDMMSAPPGGHVLAGGGATKKSPSHSLFFQRRDKRALSAGSTLHPAVQHKGSDAHKDHARAGAPASTFLKVSATGSHHAEEHRAKGSAPDSPELGAASSRKSNISWAGPHKGDVTMAFDPMLPSHKQPPSADGDGSRRDHTAVGLFTKRGSMSSTLFPQHRKGGALSSSSSLRKEERSSSAAPSALICQKWPGKAFKDVETSPSLLPVSHADTVPAQSASFIGSALFQRRQAQPLSSSLPPPHQAQAPAQSASFVGSALFQRRQASQPPTPKAQQPQTPKAESAPAPTASFMGSALFQRRQARLRGQPT